MKKALLCWLLTQACLAQDHPPIELRADAVLGDVMRMHRPYHAQVEVRIQDPNLRVNCDLSLDGAGGFEVNSVTPVQLGPGTASFSLPGLSSSYSNEVRLLGVPKELQASVALSGPSAGEQDFVALTLTPRKSHFAYLGGYQSLLQTQNGEFRLNRPPRLDNLPSEWWGYLGHDAVIVHDLPALKLSDQVETALLQWTQAGGLLVLVSNQDPHEYAGSRLEKVVPSDNMVAWRSGPKALLWKRRLGCGWVFQVRAPIQAQEALGSKRTLALWSQIVADRSGQEFRGRAFDNTNRLSELPELPAPATAALAWYLAVYVLVAIPFIYTYLRRRDQVLRLILVVPATSVVFAGGAYYFNSLGRGDELVMRELGLAWLVSGQTVALCDHTSVLFSPAAVRFRLEMPADTLFRPDSELRRGEAVHTLTCRGTRLTLDNERIPQWGVSRWRSLGLRELPGPLQFSSRSEGNSFVLDIENRTGLTLHDLVFSPDPNHNQSYRVPDLRAGQQQIRLEQSQASGLEVFLEGLPGAEPYLFRTQVESASGSHPVLLGWCEQDQFAALRPLDIQPKTYRRTLLVVSEEQP